LLRIGLLQLRPSWLGSIYRRQRVARLGYLSYFRARNEASPRNPQLADLVVWVTVSTSASMSAMARAISALINPWGITNHSLTGIDLPFTTFLHTGLVNDNTSGGVSLTGTVRHVSRQGHLRTGPGC